MIALREALQQRRGQVLATGIAVGLALVIAWAHGGVGNDHMGDEQMSKAITVCLAVVQTAGGLLGGALAVVAARRRSWARGPGVSALRDAPPPRRLGPVWPRAGPVELQVLLR